MTDVRGQGYDGAGNMAGREKGCAARIKSKYPDACYVHCHSHQLNLCVVKITKIGDIKDMFDSCGFISRFFEDSPKRTQFYEHNLKETEMPAEKKKKLLNICRTRYNLCI